MSRLDVSGIEKILREQPGIVDDLARAGAERIVTDIKTRFNTSPPGRVYPVGQGVTHTASQPGYPPNVDTGALRASIRAGKVRGGVWKIMDGVDYGVDLEFGKARVAPRPFMRPAFERLRQDWPAFARAFLQRRY